MILAKECLKLGGFLKPLLVPSKSLIGPSLCNPTILIDQKDILVNIRNINYVLYHSEKNKYEHIWGPLCYLHQENEQRLSTNNIICRLDDNFDIINHNIVETHFLDQKPLWSFVGLEDARLIKWKEKIYLSGVRRDTTSNGVGRMELSEISFLENKVVEKSRLRIPAPGKDDSYCEKNWMPILNKEYTYVKWTNPTEVVEVDPEQKTCKTINLSQYKDLKTNDLRGGSQVLFIDNNYVSIVHEVDLFNSEAGRKNGIYKHRFVIWDENFDIIKVSEKFSFMGGQIEFCCGMAELDSNLYITFGFQDNAAYILKLPKSFLKKL